MPVPRLQLKLKRELFSRRCENVTNRKVIRLKGGEQAEIKARAAAERINHYLHAPYALGSAVLSTFGVPNIDPRALFCSQLVARAYADVKIAVVPGIEPEKITPGMLATSTRFDDITKTVVFATRAVPEHLVIGTLETLGDREVASVEKMYQELWPFFVELAIPPSRDWTGMLVFHADVDDKETQKKFDLAVMKAMQSSGYIKSLGAIRGEVIKPLDEWLATLDPSSLSDELAALYRFSFTNNLKALKRQAEIDLDNQRFWAEEYRKSVERSADPDDAVRTFVALTKYSETQHSFRQEAIKLTETAIKKLASPTK